MKQIKLSFRLKVKVNGKTVIDMLMHSKNRFFRKIGTINWQNRPSVYIRVNYEVALDNYGKYQVFYNDGFYNDKNELTKAVKAFMEL
jgi:hypothetical protein